MMPMVAAAGELLLLFWRHGRGGLLAFPRSRAPPPPHALRSPPLLCKNKKKQKQKPTGLPTLLRLYQWLIMTASARL
jgi:hypothetical protein